MLEPVGERAPWQVPTERHCINAPPITEKHAHNARAAHSGRRPPPMPGGGGGGIGGIGGIGMPGGPPEG